MHVALLITIILSSGNCYAAADSLPDCINTMKISSESSVTEYEYKGQRWFGFTKINQLLENEVSDKIIRTSFYNSECKLIFTWIKGGITGMNKVSPDTIKKTKIKNTGVFAKDVITQYPDSSALPDTILKMALAQNVQEVMEYLYQDKTLYTFHYRLYSNPRLPEKGSVTIDDPYYDKTGKVILIYKRAISGAFRRAEHWLPNTVKRSDVTKIKNGVWIRATNNYIKQRSGL